MGDQINLRAFHAEYHTAHPLLGSKVPLADISNETRYQSYLDIDSPSWLPDHEIMGQVVLPGAAFIELAIAASGTSDIKDVVFERPLQLASRTALQTVVRTGDDKQRIISTFSAPTGDTNWTRNFTAQFIEHKSEPMSAIGSRKHRIELPRRRLSRIIL